MHYHWQDPHTLIRDVEFYSPHKKEEALIYAPEGVESEKLHGLADKLRTLGFVTEPDMEADQYVLRVKKFHARHDLLRILEQEGYTQGAPDTHKSDYDANKHQGLKPQQVTGLLYMMGDTILIGSGMMRNGWLNDKSFFGAMSGPGKKDITGSAKWLFAGALLYFLGSKDPDKQQEYAYHDLASSMEKAGFSLTSEDRHSLRLLAEHKDGLLPKLERLVRENPLIINSILQAAGGADNIAAGLEQGNKYKAMSGASTFLGHTTSLLTDETPKEELQKKQSGEKKEEDHRGVLEKFNDWRHEKKYRMAGAASVLSSLLRLVSGYSEVKENKAKLTSYDTKAQSFLDAAQQSGAGSQQVVALAGDIVHGRTNTALAGEHTLLKDANALWTSHTKDINARHAAKIEWGVNSVKAVANWYYALAGGNINADIKKLGILGEICNSVAHIASKEQDPELRTVLISSAAAMLAEQKGIDNPEAEILALIQEKLAIIEKNPWEKHITPSVIPTAPAAPHTPAAKVHQVATHIPPTPQMGTEAHL